MKSFNEIDTTVKRASKSIGFEWGIAEELGKTNRKGVLWANQFDNIVNCESHIKTTAEEIWNQTSGKVEAFICSVGTGGTLAGVSIGLKN